MPVIFRSYVDDVLTQHNMSDRKKILIVDDENINIEILKSILESDHEILTALGGSEGIAQIENEQPDLVLLDMEMPDVNGLKVCQAAKANTATRGIPIIFVTSMSETSDEETGLIAGACDYIAKPVNAAIVKARVAIHLQRRLYEQFIDSLIEADDLTTAEIRSRANAIRS